MDEVFQPTVFLRYQRALRGVLIDNQPWLVARDLGCLIRERVEHYVIHRLDADLRRQVTLASAGGEETAWVVNDYGLFHVLQRQRCPESRDLRRWLTGEVLPALRDQALHGIASPKRLMARGEGRPFSVLDWQGQLWVAMTEMPRLIDEERQIQRAWWRRA